MSPTNTTIAPAARGSAAGEDIAVTGLACLFPGAPDLGTYWRNIVGKVSAITNPPPEAWDDSQFYDVASEENDRVYCRKGGYLGPLAFFDPLDHGIMPRSVEGGEPDQWLALRVARDALRDAGYPDGVPQRERAALILGKGTYANRGTISVVYHGVVIDYTLQLLKSIHPELTEDDLRRVRQDLKRRLPRFDVETAPALIPNVTVGRIANRLDLMGPSYTIDAACASSLVAVDLAVKGLRHGEYDLALVGGMQVATPVPVLSLFCRLKALSLTEHIRPFDKDADGTLLSEGIGMAVLKRRSDAERDGDRIYALVKGTGVASDGRAVSVLAPRREGEELAVRQAYDTASVSPRTIGLVEAHGTATLVGDAVEVDALGRVFGERRGFPHCALGSVKSMIGHTMPAAGMAGFIKMALSLYHKVLPPTLGVTEPSPRLKLESTPFYINTETRPWIHGHADHPRRAGVNAFGFGGINAHVILEEAPPSARYLAHEVSWETELCLFAGATREEVIAAARQALAAVRRVPALALADVAFTLNTQFERTESREVVLAIVAGSIDDLARKLERTLPRLADPACRKIKEVSGIYLFDEPLASRGGLAFLFPGEGAQYVNMLADLCRIFPEVRACFDEMDRQFARDPRGYVVSDLVFPRPAFSHAERDQAERRLWDMDAAVEAVYTANHALHTLLTEFGITPDAILGHSTGEYSAMRAAAMLEQEGHERRVHQLNRIYEGASAGGRVPANARLMAVGAPRERVESACARFGDAVRIAMDNCRHQVVAVAATEVAGAVEELFKEEGFLYEILEFDRPYHTPAFAEYAQELRGLLKEAIARPPILPLYSATSVGLFPPEMDAIHQLAYDHWLQPVEFTRTIERMYSDGIRIFLEVGPRGNLTAFVDDILNGKQYAAISANVSRRSGVTQLNHLLAQAAAHGVRFTVAPLYRWRRLNALDLAEPIDPQAPARPLGRVKIPTGAPEMGLSPDVAALVRARARGAAPYVREEAPAAAVVQPHAPDTGSPYAAAAPVAPVPSAPAMPPRDAPGVLAGAAAADVMSAYLGTMERFLGIQQDLVGALMGEPVLGTELPSLQDEESATAFADTPRLALIDSIGEHRAGESVTARCTVDLERFPWLRDHALGRDISASDPDLPAFAVVPFTGLAEMMAEAAALLMPGQVLVAMHDVRVNRWVALDRGRAALEVQARTSGAGEVTVRLLDCDDSGAAPIADATMTFAGAYPPAPLADPHGFTDLQPYKWPPARMYDEAMFHGPTFQGVLSMDGVGRSGAVATLAAMDLTSITAGADARLITDFVLLDLPGQVVGFWASHVFTEGFLVLPFHMESLRLYGPLLPAGERLTCAARIVPIGEQRLRAALDVVRADGRLWARFEGWEDRRFNVPASALRLLLTPATVLLSEVCAPPAEGRSTAAVVARRLGPDSFPPGWLGAHGGLWTRVLASAVLSRTERELWHALPAARRADWLLARIAGKDAVRDYVRQRFDVSLRAADVELTPDEHGRLLVNGPWTRAVARTPRVSISHVDGAFFAVAGDGEDGEQVTAAPAAGAREGVRL